GAWLGPALERWLHLRLHESLFGPSSDGAGGFVARIPPERETAVMDAGPRRLAGDRAPLGDRAQLRVALVDFWFAGRVLRQPVRQGAREWHEKMTDKEHKKKHAGADVDDCGCRKALKQGLQELDRLLAA